VIGIFVVFDNREKGKKREWAKMEKCQLEQQNKRENKMGNAAVVKLRLFVV
jgi:hypothetical protein